MLRRFLLVWGYVLAVVALIVVLMLGWLWLTVLLGADYVTQVIALIIVLSAVLAWALVKE